MIWLSVLGAGCLLLAGYLWGFKSGYQAHRDQAARRMEQATKRMRAQTRSYVGGYQGSAPTHIPKRPDTPGASYNPPAR